MGIPTQYYIDPAIAGNSGSGTIGDPYGDVQYALDQIVRDAVDGDQLNIKAGTDEILVSDLDLTAYGSPVVNASLVFRGYTAVANDGGIGGISGNGSVSILDDNTQDAISFLDMHLHNCGAAVILDLDNSCLLYNCELDNTSGNGVKLDNNSRVLFCHFHNIGGEGIEISFASIIAFNTFENGVNVFSIAARINSDGAVISNVFDVSGATFAIFAIGMTSILGNSIYASSGTGTGIGITGDRTNVINNIVEGFSGVGGIGIDDRATGDLLIKGFNAFFNNTTNETGASDVVLDLGNDQFLASSPFIDAANDDFSVDTSVKALAFPIANYPGLPARSYFDIGALQRQEPTASLLEALAKRMEIQ